MDKLSGDLSRCLPRDYRKTTRTIDDFLKALERELQVMEQDKIKEINSMTKLQTHSSAAFYTDQTQSPRTQHRTACGTKDYTGPKKSAAEWFFCGSSHRASDCSKHINVNDRQTERTLFQLSEKTPRWIVFCSSMRKRNVPEVRRKAPQSSSQGSIGKRSS